MVDSIVMQSGRYKAYPEYKDSGVEWLGGIPIDWKFSKLKRTCSVKGGYAFKSELFSDSGIPVIRIGDIHRDGSIDLSGCKYIPIVSPLVHKEYSVTNGQILMAMTGATIGKAGRYSNLESALINQRVGKFELNNQNILYSFLWYILQTDGYQNYIKLTAFGGAQPNISDVEMVDLHVTIPTKEEQESIANFLDHETAKIDTLIEKQQRLIELLIEKRQAVISQAVTKGLNPDVPMKDSGVEWLGEVPEHWEVVPLKHLVDTPITDGPHETPNFLDTGVPFISAEAISQGYINFDKKRAYISELDNIKYSKKYSPKKYDIYVVKSGATTGISAIVETDEKFNIWSPLAVIRCRSEFEPYFTLFAIRSHYFQESIKLYWNYGTQQNIGMSVLENLKVACPPRDEALDISKYLKEINEVNDSLIAKAQKQVALMQERRTALISAAVTGKIDVRDWVKPE